MDSIWSFVLPAILPGWLAPVCGSSLWTCSPRRGEFLGRLGWRVEVFEGYCGVSVIWLCNRYISDRVEIFRTERV